MPVKTFRKTKDHREPTTPPTFLDQINGMPNPETDGFTWMHRTINSLALYGNSYWLITARDRNGFPSEVFNLHPDDVKISRKMEKQYIDLMKRTSLDTQLSIHLVRLFI